MSLDKAIIEVPSSTANVGPGYDIWSVAIRSPYLKVTCTRTKSGIEVLSTSPHQPPAGRELGYAGGLAAAHFLQKFDIKGGVSILYEDSDDGYPVGGLGRSGAEIVGAILSAAVAYDKILNLDELTTLSHQIEGHPDNVAASINGRFSIMATSPYNGGLIVDCYDLPENLGIAIGFSSHQKTGGTEAGRRVLRDPVPVADFVAQTGLVSMITAALIRGNVHRFLELVWGDRFHEPRRADAGFYGKFTGQDLAGLKRELFEKFNVGLCVSGAGPNMQAWYNKNDHLQGIAGVISPVVVPWFRERDIEMRIEEMGVAREGAHAYAQRVYGYGRAAISEKT